MVLVRGELSMAESITIINWPIIIMGASYWSETHCGVLEGSGRFRVPGAAGAWTWQAIAVATIFIMRLRHPLRGRQRGRGPVIKQGAILKQSSSPLSPATPQCRSRGFPSGLLREKWQIPISCSVSIISVTLKTCDVLKSVQQEKIACFEGSH